MEDFGKVYNPKGAASIVINVKTGEILAMASYPSYEPKDFLRRDVTREMERI